MTLLVTVLHLLVTTGPVTGITGGNTSDNNLLYTLLNIV